MLLHWYLMASWSAVPSAPKTQAPVLPEPGLSSYPTVAAKSQQAEGIKLRHSHLTVRKMANSLEGGNGYETQRHKTRRLGPRTGSLYSSLVRFTHDLGRSQCKRPLTGKRLIGCIECNRRT